ncbi:hypothetical protein P9112_009516 [Eukaryota sp. TZLM1-RC]
MSDSEPEAVDVGTYEGERNEDGARHGQGKCEYANGDKYEGTYDSGVRSGEGTYIWQHPEHSFYYQGNYDQGIRNGEGKLNLPDGSSYSGQWKDGLPHGEGTFTYANGDTYTGQVEKGQREGEGSYKFALTEEVLSGTWEEGQISEGSRQISPKVKWVGQFLNGQPMGKGYFEFIHLGYRQYGKYVLLSALEPENDEQDNESDNEEDEDQLNSTLKMKTPDVKFVPGRIAKI